MLMQTFFKGVLRPLWSLLYPNLCVSCQIQLTYSEKFLCFDCMHELPRTLFQYQAGNLLEQRMKGRLPLRYGASMYFFRKEGKVQDVLHAIKYQNNQDLAFFMGEQFGEALRVCGWVDTIDVLIPVPLSENKQKQRGFNQSEWIAKGLSKAMGTPVNTKALIRTRDTSTQTHKNREERYENVKDAFEVIDWSGLKGAHIALVDDVFTTGSTLESCGIAFLKKHNVEISILTLAFAIE